MQPDLVRAGYASRVDQYLATREGLGSGKYVRKLLKVLPPHSIIVDLGCGAGIPVDDLFIASGHAVVGIDLSPVMIARARKNCPAGEYRVGRMEDLRDGQFSVAAVVSFYALFHVPRSQHAEILRKIASWLTPGGWLLITMGDVEFEGEHEWLGTTMWSSQWGHEQNRALVEQAGLRVQLDELDVSGGERHQVILAQKRLIEPIP